MFTGRGLLRLLAFIGSLGLSILNIFFIILGIGNKSSISQLMILFPLILEYCLVGLTAVCFAALVKKGFNNLKSYDVKALIVGLSVALIIGLIVGLITGLMIAGLIVGSIFGWVVGVIYDIEEEFREEEEQ